jgi:hypothetical protein
MQKYNFKKLIIWHEAMELCDMVYLYTYTLPNKEKFNLITQLESCSVSITSNNLLEKVTVLQSKIFSFIVKIINDNNK